jgi:hypothetical protein
MRRTTRVFGARATKRMKRDEGRRRRSREGEESSYSDVKSGGAPSLPSCPKRQAA